jgi:hypothetical protein
MTCISAVTCDAGHFEACDSTDGSVKCSNCTNTV